MALNAVVTKKCSGISDERDFMDVLCTELIMCREILQLLILVSLHFL